MYLCACLGDSYVAVCMSHLMNTDVDMSRDITFGSNLS
jgi:hypothetical protein